MKISSVGLLSALFALSQGMMPQAPMANNLAQPGMSSGGTNPLMWPSHSFSMMPGAPSLQQMMPSAAQQMMPGMQTPANIGGPSGPFDAAMGMLPFMIPGMSPQTKKMMLMTSLIPNMGGNGGQGNPMMRMLPLIMGGGLENMGPMAMMMMMGQSGISPMQMMLMSGGEMNMQTMLPMMLAGGLGQGNGRSPGGQTMGRAY